MSPPAALWAHVHVTERESAHTWPDGRPDDARWEDCLWASAIELARVAHDAGIPATHVEAEALRAASGEPPTGGSNTGDLARGYAARYHWTVPAVAGAAAIWTALRPGTAAVVTGSMIAFPFGHTLRRWDPNYAQGHAVFAARLDATDRVWWCDPLAPTGVGYAGEWVSKANLAAFIGALPGAAAVAAAILPPEDPMGLKVNLAVTHDPNPYDALGTAKVKTATSATKVADGLAIAVAAGLDLGVVQKGTLDVAASASPIVALNYVGELAVLPLAAVTFTPLPAPVTDCAPAVKAATDPLKTQIETLKASLATAQAALEAAPAAERKRIADKEAERIEAL